MKLRNNPIIYLAGKTWQYSVGNHAQVLLYAGLFLGANIVNFFEPLLVAKLLNTIQEQGITADSLPMIIFLLASFLLITMAFWAFHGPARVIENKNAFIVRAKYKKYLLDGAMNLPTEWHTDHHSGDTIDKIEKGTTALYNFSCETWLIIEAIIKLVGSYAALAYFNFHATYIILIIGVITFTIIIKIDKILVAQYKELNRAENKISAKIFDALSNITTVIILRIEKLISKAIFQKIMNPFDLHVKNSKLNEFKWFLVSICANLMIFFVLTSYIYYNYLAGTAILIGAIYALYGYVSRISELFYHFAYSYSEIVKRRTAVMNAEEISNEFKNNKKEMSSKLLLNWHELKIRDLRFSYMAAPGANSHLDGVSLAIKRGARIALIGESGSGKTTFMKIIRDLYHPNKVKIFVDGKFLRGGFSAISSAITLIPQDPEIFNTTIRENITLGVNYKLSDVNKFTEMAAFSGVARRLPNGLESSIMEKGVNLSGGERQRLALARGLLASRDKELVLLDEPTSSVDFKNEIEIYKNIFREFKNKTIISSIHRLHLLPLFDYVYFFRDGKIIAEGTFRELLTKSPDFQTIWEKQNRALLGQN